MVETMIAASEAILLEASCVWEGLRESYRDTCVRVGQLLSDFIVARLKEADGLPEMRRIEQGLTRERGVRDIAKKLQITQSRAHEMIRVFRVVDLFGDPGNLSYSALRAFTVFAQRKSCVVTRNRFAEPGAEVTPSESEEWEVKPVQSGPSPADLYREAKEENWNCSRIRRTIKSEVVVRRRGGAGPKYSTGLSAGVEDYLPPLRKLGKDTNTKDLLDMMMEVIQACPQRIELKRLLLEKIR